MPASASRRYARSGTGSVLADGDMAVAHGDDLSAAAGDSGIVGGDDLAPVMRPLRLSTEKW
jgi:hypothetical protein